MLYEKQALIADPIHNYIPFTVPYGKRGEITEKELIDSPWMQRLRYINQLQSARWVYPSAEHSRFVHSLGTMHIAGRFAKHIYPSLKEQNPDCPSFCFIESLLRMVGLVHDIGHGPFCHFFDDHFLKKYRLTHESLGQYIVLNELAPLIKGIERSISGEFAAGERMDPEQVAFLMGKAPQAGVADIHLPLVGVGGEEALHLMASAFPPRPTGAVRPPGAVAPPWLAMLRPLFSGIFTVDNLDYVLRDAYMCGVAVGPVDLDRLMHYTFCTKEGLTLHKAGLPALRMFLNARSYLYFNVYYHRTTRALDIHLRDIFSETMREIFPYHPVKRLDHYLALTDWSLLLAVQSWKGARSKKRKALFREWQKILLRDVKWKMAYDTTFSPKENQTNNIKEVDLEKEIRRRLPVAFRRLRFRVDMASQDPRPMNPGMMGDRQVYIYNPSNQSVSKEALMEFIDSLPSTLIQCRVFALNHDHDLLLSNATEEGLRTLSEKKAKEENEV